jgi:transposase
MRAYSEDLRMKTVAAIERGMSKSLAARLFDVSLSSVKRYQRLANQGGSVRPRKSSRRPRKADETAQRLLEEDLKERPAVIIGQKYRLLEHITLAHRPLEGRPGTSGTLQHLHHT